MRGLRIPEAKRARALRRTETSAETKLWARLRSRRLNGFKFVRQMPIGPYFADFVCREEKLIVEVDGATHSSSSEILADRRRSAFLIAEGYRVVRVTNARGLRAYRLGARNNPRCVGAANDMVAKSPGPSP